MESRRRGWRRWLWRYGPQELSAVLLASLAAELTRRCTVEPGALVVAYFLGDNLGCHGFGFLREWRRRGPDRFLRRALASLRHQVLEFGAAELCDLWARPLLLSAAAHGSDSLASLWAGALAASLVYYGIAGLSLDALTRNLRHRQGRSQTEAADRMHGVLLPVLPAGGGAHPKAPRR